MEEMKEDKDLAWAYEMKKPFKIDQYAEENKKLLQSRKKELYDDLNKISHNLNTKKDINEFLEDKKNYLANNILAEVKERKSKYAVFFNIKIIGVVFLVLYLIGIYQLTGLNEAIQDEIVYSLKLHYFNQTKNYTFYEIYNKKNNHELPSLSLFFISSFLSNCLFQSLGFYLLTIIIIILNGLIILFGLNNFNFHEKNDNNIIEDYSTKELSLLFIYLISLNVFLGFVAMLPQKLFLNAYYYYEKWLKIEKGRINNNIELIEKDENIKNENIENEEKENIINIGNINKNENKNDKKLSITKESSFNIIDINNDDIFEPKTKVVDMGKFNGFYFSYIFSFVCSIIGKLVINKGFSINKGKSQKFFQNIYIVHIIPIISALVFYIFFSSVFTKKKDKNNYVKVMKFLGYLIYIQGMPEKNEVCCLDCRIGLRKLFYGSFCYSCKICKCCECNICCRCLPFSECCRKEEDLTEIKNRNRKICIFYKLNGFCSWICEFVGNSLVVLGVGLIFLFELFNIGFKSKFFKNFQNDDINDSKSIIIIIVFLVGIIFSYFLILVSGIIYKNLIFTNQKSSEGGLLGFGLLPFVFIGSLITTIISALIYTNKINNSLEIYFIAFPMSMCEYVKLLILNSFSTLVESLELLPYSCVVSIFLLIYKLFTSIFDIFGVEPNELILFQIILGMIICGLSFCFVCCTICWLRLAHFTDINEGNKVLDEIKKKDMETGERYIQQKEELKQLNNKIEEIKKYNEEKELEYKKKIEEIKSMKKIYEALSGKKFDKYDHLLYPEKEE